MMVRTRQLKYEAIHLASQANYHQLHELLVVIAREGLIVQHLLCPGQNFQGYELQFWS